MQATASTPENRIAQIDEDQAIFDRNNRFEIFERVGLLATQ